MNSPSQKYTVKEVHKLLWDAWVDLGEVIRLAGLKEKRIGTGFWFGITVTLILAPPAILGIAWLLLFAAWSLHWIVAIVVLILLLVALLLMLIGLSGLKYWRDTPAIFVGSLLLSSITLAIAICVFISYSLEVSEPGLYSFSTENSSTAKSTGAFIKLYLWHLVDMIPILDVWDYIPVDKPVKPANVVAGIPLLLFRILMVLPILGAFTRWYSGRKKRIEHGSPDL